MPLFWLFLIVLAIATVGYVMGRSRALASADGNIRNLHSLPSYYGYNIALTVITPALGLLVAWLLFQPLYVDNRVTNTLPESAVSEGSNLSLVMSDVRRVAEGLNALVETGRMSEDDVTSMRSELTNVRDRLGEVGVALGSNVEPAVLDAAQQYRVMSNTGDRLMWIAVLLVALGGFALSYMLTNKDFRARNT
ncbi:MAG: phosphate ABC transporter permease family protein, partial [Pseudomonadota bacterium]